MIKITEDHVSFETAKLLKEKGFDDEYTNAFYDKTGNLYFIDLLSDFSNHPDNDTDITASTLYMAMKWLREVHKLYCDIRVGDGDFVVDIISLKDGEFGCEVAEPESCVYPTYEEAAEAAIKYCLENLIVSNTNSGTSTAKMEG